MVFFLDSGKCLRRHRLLHNTLTSWSNNHCPPRDVICCTEPIICMNKTLILASVIDFGQVRCPTYQSSIDVIHQCFSIWGRWDSFCFPLILAQFGTSFLGSCWASVQTGGGMLTWHSSPASTSSIGHCCIRDNLFTLNSTLTGFTQYNDYYYKRKGSKESFLSKGC